MGAPDIPVSSKGLSRARPRWRYGEARRFFQLIKGSSGLPLCALHHSPVGTCVVASQEGEIQRWSRQHKAHRHAAVSAHSTDLIRASRQSGSGAEVTGPVTRAMGGRDKTGDGWSGGKAGVRAAGRAAARAARAAATAAARAVVEERRWQERQRQERQQ